MTTEMAWASTSTTTIPTPPDRAYRAQAMATVNVLASVLSVRLTLLVSVGGAIGLTWLAVRDPDPYRLAALGVYAAVVVVPLVWLSSRH